MLPFLEKLLQVLAQGGFVATYKYAVLLGLIDLCMEAGEPPTMVTTAQLARRVVELYWPQVRPFPDRGVLRQNTFNQAKIARLVANFRQARPDLAAPSPTSPSPGWQRLLDEVEWVLVEYPLPRLQRVAGGEERFLYEIGWGEDVSRRAFLASKRGDGTAFDNRILFKPGAAEALVALAPVVRPLVQQQWTAMVQRINDLPGADHEEFLFGAARVGLGTLHRPLRLLQDGRCFYCGGAFAGAAQVDHFLPWSRYPDDGLDNLVLAHERCNREKLHFLADLEFGHRWEERSRARSGDMDEIAAEARWNRDRARTFGVVASVYRGVPDGVRLWAGDGRFRRLEVADLPDVRAFGRGLVEG